MPSDIGSSTIALDDALRRADFRSEQEQREFCQHLCKTMEEKVRQQLLTWRANKITPPK